MGKDFSASGAEYNAKMSYSSGGIVSSTQLNTIGRNLNNFNSSVGANLTGGINGGMDFEADTFPWFDLDFGYLLGAVVDENDSEKIDYSKVKVGGGFFYLTDIDTHAHLSQFAAYETNGSYYNYKDVEISSDIEAGFIDVIYLKVHLYKLGTVNAFELVVVQTSLSDPSSIKTNVPGVLYFPLFSFFLKHDEAILYSIFNMGSIDAYISHFHAQPDTNASFGYYLWPTSATGFDKTKIVLAKGNVIHGYGQEETVIQVNGISFTIGGSEESGTGTMIYLKYDLSTESASTAAVSWYTEETSLGSPEFKPSTDSFQYVPMYMFTMSTATAASGGDTANESVAKLFKQYNFGDVIISKVTKEELVFDVTWDADTCELLKHVREYYVTKVPIDPGEPDPPEPEVITTAEYCPDEEY